MLVPLLLVAVLALSLGGTFSYIGFAERRGIVATQNARTLHQHVVPRGAGVVFAGAFAGGVALLGIVGELPLALVLAIGAGGAAAAAIGWIDDIFEVRQIVKLASHVGLSALAFAVLFGGYYAGPLRHLHPAAALLVVAAVLFVPVWAINMYNFVDGIDGLAITASVFICGAIMIVLALNGGDRRLVVVFGLLLVASLGFLVLNLPPARVFMGDAGSTALGYGFGTLALITIATGQINPWTWLTVFGYYIGDTTTTTLCRMAMVPRWYRGHRSHAYQNLARLHGHARVTYGVLLFDVLWVLPLTVWSARRAEWAPLAAALAVAPASVWALRFGPLLSRD